MAIRDHEYLPSKFLEQQAISVADAEAENMVPVLGRMVPFGFLNDDWEKLKSKMKSDGVLRSFKTPVCVGIALVQDNAIFDFIVITMTAPITQRPRQASDTVIEKGSRTRSVAKQPKKRPRSDG